MKATEEQIQQWKDKHGSIYELEYDGRIAYVFDPINKLVIMKALMQAMIKGSFEFVDAFIANCFLGGDETIKQDNRVKAGLIEKVQDLVDIPEHTITIEDDHVMIVVEDRQFKVRRATRLDIKYAEDKNKANKALDTQIHLLERIAVDPDQLNEWRQNNRLYMALLLAVNEVKDKSYVSIKKL